MLVFEPLPAQHTDESRLFPAEAEVRVHGGFSRVDLAANSARVNVRLASIT